MITIILPEFSGIPRATLAEVSGKDNGYGKIGTAFGKTLVLSYSNLVAPGSG